MNDRYNLIRTFNQEFTAISSPKQRNIKMIVLNFSLFPKRAAYTMVNADHRVTNLLQQ